MPIITPRKSLLEYDVIVVGSGAAGGMSAYVLAKAGVKVLMLEAGRNYDPAAETAMFETAKDAPLRGTSTPDKHFGYFDATVNGGWTVPGEPYAVKRKGEQGFHEATDWEAKSTKQEFMWWRPRMLGGRTNHWGRISLRNGPYDFKPKRRDGLGLDWPMDYEDVAPYYDKVEMLIGVYGTAEGLENTPDSPPGVLQPAPAMRAGEQFARAKGKKLGLPVIPIHRAVLSVKQDADRLPAKLHPNNA